MTKISIIGSGTVGTATGKGLDKLGHKVIFNDISSQRLSSIKKDGYKVTTSIKEAISKTEVSFICVNTPVINKVQDLSSLFSALSDIKDALNSINKFHLLVFRSTFLPGTMRKMVTGYLKRNCILKIKENYDVIYNPEFLREKTALQDYLNPDRIVIGIGEKAKGKSFLPAEVNSVGLTTLKDLYKSFLCPFIITSYENAEMIKFASNCFLALKISYFNEISMLCHKIGLDDKVVSSAVAMDKRIGKYGTEPGKPFSGSCLPKDMELFTSLVKELKVKPDLIKVSVDINKKIELYKKGR